MDITGANNGSLKEVMDNTLHNLRNANPDGYLSAQVKSGRGKFDIVTANKRGFVVALDWSTNPAFGYMSPSTASPNTANLVTTASRQLDRMTINYQYIQTGHELDNENLANSKSDLHVGPSSQKLAIMKELDRRMEMEEWYFCRGDGTQIIGDITAGVSIAAAATGTITCSGTRDGAGAFMIRQGQRIRIYDVTLTTLKSYATVTAKASNTSISIKPDSNLTSGNAVVDTDVILPESDTGNPTTAGVKGLPYLAGRTSGAYFDKSLSSIPDLQPTIDSSTTTFTRTTMEQLRRKHRDIRNSGAVKISMIATAPAQVSNYFSQFYSQHTANVNVVGNQRPGIDNGAASEDYTHWGQKINSFNFIHPKYWFYLDLDSFARVTLKEAGAMLTVAGDYVQKVTSGQYVNAQQRWSDDYLEYFSPEPNRNAAFTGLAFTNLPLLVNSASIG